MRWLALVVVAGCWTREVPEPAHPQPETLAMMPRTQRVQPHQVRDAGQAPSIEMGEALDAARGFALDKGVRFDRQYLQGAVFDSVARLWVFDWQMPNVKGGLTIVTVHESGKISINYGE